MSNIVSYVKRNQSLMNDEDINNADALILSWLSYFNYADYLKFSSLKISAIEGKYTLPKKEMYQDAFMPRNSYQLFTCLKASPRFSSLTLSDFSNIKDEDKCEQFAAITICLNPNLYFISFRGTDPSFLGWEEDFKLAYLPFTASQIDGVSYVEQEIDKHPKAMFLLGGHSKGGNVAIYAGSLLPLEKQKKIKRIYSFDGPGFPSSFFEETGYASIKDRIRKIVPSSSFVGFLFNNKYPYQIIKSQAVVFLQHNPFCFVMKGNDFVAKNKRSSFSLKSEYVMTNWINNLDIEERERYIKIIFIALNKLKIRDFNSFFYSLPIQVFHLLGIYRRVAKSDQFFFKKTTKALLKLCFTSKRKIRDYFKKASIQ